MISLKQNAQTIQHGGNVDEAIRRYNISKDEWIDLSTGISPWAYPFKELPKDVWQSLPPSNQELLSCAAKYYNVNIDRVIATPGTQIAIRLIPQFFQPSKVAIPSLGYQEHTASWQMANHHTVYYQNTEELITLLDTKSVDHLVLINPNNPNGDKLSLDVIETIISKVRGICIIDEAFIDYYDEENSTSQLRSATKINNYHDYENLIILRSIGKFFGLAGIRLGFALGSHPSLAALNALLNPWSISHISQHIGIQALQDKQWQAQQRLNINKHSHSFEKALERLLINNLKEYSKIESGLFNTVFAVKPELKILHEQLARKGVWTRLCNDNDQPSWLRFGLPKDIDEFEKRTLNISSEL